MSSRPFDRRAFKAQRQDTAEIPPLSTLFNLKKILAHTTPEYFLVESHFLTQLLEPLLQTVHVDEGWYLEKYPDVQTSMKAGTVKSAKEHYMRFGFFEHRMPYQIEVDEGWYLDQYADVRACVSREDVASGQDHYNVFGFREGRMPYSNFSLRKAKTGA